MGAWLGPHAREHAAAGAGDAALRPLGPDRFSRLRGVAGAAGTLGDGRIRRCNGGMARWPPAGAADLDRALVRLPGWAATRGAPPRDALRAVPDCRGRFAASALAMGAGPGEGAALGVPVGAASHPRRAGARPAAPAPWQRRLSGGREVAADP